MIFKLSSSCFRCQINPMPLIALAHKVLNGRHRFYVPNERDDAYIKWVCELGPLVAKQWHLASRTSMELEAREPATVSVTVCEESALCDDRKNLIVRVADVNRIIQQPFKVFVENDNSDRNFLLTFSNTHQFNKIIELECQNLLSFEHCGGISELRRRVKTYATNAQNYLNCTAVFDSDAPSPGVISRDARKAEEQCDSLGLDFFRLRRRAIENYLMRDWLKTWVNNKKDKSKIKIFDIFAKLSLEQRSHFHMKNGLKKDKSDIDNGTLTLYKDVNRKDLVWLQDGFGPNLASELYAEEWIQKVQSVDDTTAWEEVNGMVNAILVQCR